MSDTMMIGAILTTAVLFWLVNRLDIRKARQEGIDQGKALERENMLYLLEIGYRVELIPGTRIPNWVMGGSSNALEKTGNKPSIEEVAWVFEKINESISLGGTSYRYLIYNIMGFEQSAYMPLYIAGGMNITNLITEGLTQEKIDGSK